MGKPRRGRVILLERSVLAEQRGVLNGTRGAADSVVGAEAHTLSDGWVVDSSFRRARGLVLAMTKSAGAGNVADEEAVSSVD